MVVIGVEASIAQKMSVFAKTICKDNKKIELVYIIQGIGSNYQQTMDINQQNMDYPTQVSFFSTS